MELIDHLHDIVHEEGWDAPAGIAWLLSDQGEDAPPHAALDELAASELFTVTTKGGSYPQVTLAFSYAGRVHYRAAELQTAPQASAEDRPLSADTVARLAEQMARLPGPTLDDAPKKVEWQLDGYGGWTGWGTVHLMVLGDDADPATLRHMTPPTVAALDERWGPHAELQASTLPTFDRTAETPDPRSILSALVTAVEGTTILWWRPEVHRVVMMTIREAPQDHLTALLVTMPEMLDGLVRSEPPVKRKDVAGMDLADIAAFAMRFSWSQEDRAAFREPPYPLPSGLVPAIEALEAALPAGHEHARGARVMYRAGLPAVVLRLLTDGVLDRRHDAEFLISTAAESDLPAKDRDLVVRDLLVHLVDVHLGADDVTAAERAAERIGEVTPRTSHLGWRRIAAYHAANGDASSFLRLWSRYDARQDRVEIRRLKSQLIRSVAVREGWRAAVELCGDKRIGEPFRRHAFEPPAYGYDDLRALFSGEAAGVLDEVGELHALVAAVTSESPRPPTEDHRGVEGLLTRISALDPEISRAAMRERDNLLFDLRGAIGDEETLARLRTRLRTPRLVRAAMRPVAEPRDDADSGDQAEPVDDCPTCDTVGVPGTGALPWDIDATTDALIERVRTGRMRELRHDVPLHDIVPLVEAEMKYTVTSFLECLDCGRVLMWANCVRGHPILQHTDREAIDRWPWDAVPPRERWARSDPRAEEAMRYVDHEPQAWFLVRQEETLYLEARYSYSAFIDDSVLIELDAAELKAYGEGGHAYLSTLAEEIHMSAPYTAQSPYYARDLYRHPGATGRDYRNEVSAAIKDHTWIAGQRLR